MSDAAATSNLTCPNCNGTERYLDDHPGFSTWRCANPACNWFLCWGEKVKTTKKGAKAK